MHGVELDNSDPCPACKCPTTIKQLCLVCDGACVRDGAECRECLGHGISRECSSCSANFWRLCDRRFRTFVLVKKLGGGANYWTSKQHYTANVGEALQFESPELAQAYRKSHKHLAMWLKVDSIPTERGHE